MPWDNKSPIYIWLVVTTPLKNMKVSWDDDIPNMENHPNGSKPPTRLLIWLMIDNNEYSMVRALWWYICSTGFIDSIYIYMVDKYHQPVIINHQ